ncbi:hypothetical protein [Brevundimonas sp.]|nr:hypothetical protein [Brevundimonas sp.]
MLTGTLMGRDDLLKSFVAVTVVAAAVYTALGVFGTVAFMWGPYL